MVQAGHVVAVHAEWGMTEGSVRVVAAELGSIGRVGAVEVLRIAVEGDGVRRKTEPGVDHARRKSPHPGPASVGRQEGSPGHEPHLVKPLLLAALVLEPDLDDPHRQTGLLGQLLSHQPRRLRRLVEHVLEDLELLGLDGGPGSSALVLLVLLVAVGIVVVVGAVALGVVDVKLAVDDAEVVAVDAGVPFRRRRGVARRAGARQLLEVGLHLAHERVVLAIEKAVGLAQLDVGPGGESELADGTDDTVGMEKARADLGAEVLGLEIDPAATASRPEPSVVVSLAEEGRVLSVGEAGGVEVDAAVEAPEAVAVKRSGLLQVFVVVDVVDVVVGDGRPALCATARHLRKVFVLGVLLRKIIQEPLG